MNLKTVKMASAKYYDDLPVSGNEHARAFRDLEMEQEVFFIYINCFVCSYILFFS